MKRLAIVTTHPIQYYAPVFKLLAKEVDLLVFYTWGEKSIQKYDPGFNANIAWDIPLLEGYNYEFLENSSKEPGSHHRKGIINPKIIEKVSNFKPDAILVYGWAYRSHLQTMRYFKGKIPIWFRGDSTLLDEKANFKSIIRFIYLKWVYKHIDKAFYVGKNNKDYFKKHGLKDEQLTFAPHAIDNDRFRESRESEVSALKNKLGINRNELLLLFAGKLETKKNPKILLDVFSEIQSIQQKKGSIIHLLFVGNGVLLNELQLNVKKLNLINVHFIDFINQSEMPVIYQSCDLYCLPSKGPNETWGLAINEAMAAGKAVIASNKVGAARDLVHEQKNGFTFLHSNYQEFKQKLIPILDRNILNKMGENSRKLIEPWSFKAQVNAIITSLNWLNG